VYANRIVKKKERKRKNDPQLSNYMKYIKWIAVTVNLGICYIIQKVVNREQIRFDQKGRVEAEEEEPLNKVRALIYLQESSVWECYLESVSPTHLTLELEWE